MVSKASAHTPENTILAGGVRLPAGSEVIRDRERVRLDASAKAWQFTIRSSRLALGVPDHTLLVAERGEWAVCSCAACVNLDHCGLVDDPRAVLRHHGLLPPADPGGASGCPPCWHCPTRAYCAEHGCRYDFGAPPAEAGGGTVDAAQAVVSEEIAEWTATMPATRRLDVRVAVTNGAWIQSYTAAGVRLTCASCHDVRGWATEAEAADWLVADGRCRCGCGGPTPPAQGTARKSLQDHLDVLYGE